MFFCCLAFSAPSLPSVPLLIVHMLEDVLAPAPNESMTSSASATATRIQTQPSSASSQRLVSSKQASIVGRQLGEMLMQTKSIMMTNEKDMERAAKWVEMRYAQLAAERIKSRPLLLFLESFGLACPPVMLSCIINILTNIIKRIAGSQHLYSMDLDEHEGMEMEEENYPSLHPPLTQLEIMDASYQVCRFLERLVQHHSSTSVSNSQSASVTILHSFLRTLHRDWRAAWLKHIAPFATQSFELAIHHPMLLHYLWLIEARMDQGMQMECNQRRTAIPSQAI